jgi:autotransporter-associated beta strand protein
VGSTATNCGSYWYDGAYTSADPLLNGPWGGNGPITNAITGIPYPSYEIIAYLNPPYGYGTDTVWLDSNPAASNSANPPLTLANGQSSQYYFSPDTGNGAGIGVGGNFDLMTNNTNPSSFPSGNTVVWSGLSGANQTLWTTGAGTDPSGNNGFVGFEIVNTSLAGTVWSGSNGSNWNTAGNWVGGTLPPSGGTVSFGGPSANPGVDLGASNQTVAEIIFAANVNTTIASSGAHTLFLDNTANAAPATVSVLGGTHAVNAAVQLNSNVTITLTSGQLTFGANLANGVNGSAGITVAAGGGTLVLAGSNTYTGATNIQGATTNVTGTLGNTPVSVSGGVLSLQNPGAVSQNTITVSGGVLNQTVANAVSGTAVLALNGGVTTLSQANNYSGGTTVGSGATLVATNASGSATGTTGVTVQSGGTLGGSGFIGSTVSVNAAGTIAPTPAPTGFNTLTLANLSVPSGGSLNFNVGTGSNDQVLVSNDLTLGGNMTFNVAFPAGLAAGTFQLLEKGGGTYSDTSTINVAGTPAETYTLLKPGQGGNSTAWYELQTQILTATWTGANGAAWDTVTNNWTGPAGSQYVSGQPVVFPDGATAGVTIAATVTPQSVTFTNNNTIYTLGGGAGIGGAAALALTGTGAVILAESNRFTGGTSIGTGATLQLGAGGVTGSIAAASAVSNSGSLVISRSDNASSNPLAWTNPPNAGWYAFANTISGPGGLSIAGGGFLQLTSTSNSFSGPIYVMDGCLAVNNAGNLGNSASILIGDTAGSANAGIFNNNAAGALIIPQNIHVQAGSSGSAFIAGQTANAQMTTYTGSVQIDKTTNIYSGYWGSITLSGPISGAGGLTLYPTYSGQTYFASTSETFQGNVSIGSDNTDFGPPHNNGVVNNAIHWDYNPATNNAVSTSFGQGTITVQNNMGFDFYVNAPSGAGIYTATLTNPINVLSSGGVLFGDTANTNMAVAFSGSVSLAGQLVVGVDEPASAALPINYAGQVTLDRAAAEQPGFKLTIAGNNNYGWGMGALSISGNIVDGSNGPYVNPLYLASNYFSSRQSNLILNVTGTANTYAAGTVVASGVSNVAANSSLGTGLAVVEPGAALRVNAAASVPGGVLVTSSALADGVLGLGANFDPAGILNSASQGVLAVDAAVSAPLNLAHEGNGMMLLGSVSAGSYTAASLGTDSDGNYHLGGGGGVLTLTLSNVLTGAGNLIVGQAGGSFNNIAFGRGNGGGTVKLAANQNITGAITVNGGVNNGGGNNQYDSSTLEVAVQPGASGGQPLGSGSNNVTLDGGTLQYDLPASGGIGASLSIGNLTVNGGPSVLTFTNATYGNTFTIAGSGGIVRNNAAALGIGFAYPGLGALGSTTGGVQVLVPSATGAGAIGNIVPAGNTGTNGMVSVGGVVAPWITYFDTQNHTGGGNFLAYTANGFAATTYTVNGVPGFLTEAAGSQLANTVPSDIVEIDNTAANSDASMSANTTVYALRAVKASGQLNITSNGAQPVTLSITSGGMSIDEQNGQCTIGSATANSAVNLVFGTSPSPVEAVIWTGTYNGTPSLNLYNNITAAGLTTSGYGNLVLLNNSASSAATANSISGPVTINTGTVTTSNEYNLGLGTGGNYVVLNGGQWAVAGGTSTISAHNVFMGPAGGILSITANTNYAASISDLPGQPAGVSAGPLTIIVGWNAGNNYYSSTLTLSNATAGANQWSGGTIVEGTSTSGTLDALPGVGLGTGDVTVSDATLVLGGGNLGASANLSLTGNATVIFQSSATAPAVGSLAGAGSVVLGSGGAAVTLTVGGNNASTWFNGTISENDVGGAGLTKAGSGMMTLAGADSYSGATTVSGGTLKSATFGAIPAASAVSVAGGVLDVTACPQTVGSISIGGAGALNLCLGNLLTSSGAASFAAGSTLNLSGSVATLPEVLMNYAGSATGTFSNVDLNGAPLASGDLTYNSGSLELTATILSGPSVWSSTLSGSWSRPGNWTGGVPDAIGAGAAFSGSATASLTVTLDAPQTVGTLQFGNSGSTSTSYTLGGSTLTLNNSGGSASTLTVLNGTHAISAPEEIAGGSLVVSESGSGILTISGNVSDDGNGRSLTLTGDGTGRLVLSGTNTYSGGTNVEAGTLTVDDSGALLDGSTLTVGAAASSLFAASAAPAAVVPTANVAVAAVPEPGTLALLAAALWSAAACRRFGRRTGI